MKSDGSAILPASTTSVMMNACDAAYLAGIVDGEGTVTLTKNNAADMYKRFVISVPNTDRGLVEHIHRLWGGKFISRTQRNAAWSQCFVWRVESARALEVAEVIQPFLRTASKRARVDLVLAEYALVTPRNGRYTEALEAAKRSFETRFIAL